ncbi:MAG: hypothetical protein WD431_00855, partial [Cyclobacteriaceae bacterium]
LFGLTQKVPKKSRQKNPSPRKPFAPPGFLSTHPLFVIKRRFFNIFLILSKLIKTTIYFRLAGFGVMESGRCDGKGKSLFDEWFWKDMLSL